MSPRTGRLPNPRIVVALAILAVVLAGVVLDAAATAFVAARLRALARGRDAEASWRRLDVSLLGSATVDGLAVATATDTLLRAERVRVDVRRWSVLFVRPRIGSVELRHAVVTLPARRAPNTDSLAVPPPAEDRAARARERGARVRSAAERVARGLLLPARDMPRLTVRDLAVRTASADTSEPATGITVARLDLDPRRDGIRLFAEGRLDFVRPVTFDVSLSYGHDDRLTGGARLDIPDPRGGEPSPLRLTVDGHVEQDRDAGVVSLADRSRVTVGEIPILLEGSVARDGPHLRFALAADTVTAEQVHRSVPRPLLGPLTGLDVHGSFDYRLALDLDVAEPDSVRFTADVVPHGLSLDPSGTRLDIFRLAQPFTATIRLPRSVIVSRDLSEANPNFRPLDSIDSTIAYALVTNEDGSFFRHRGFNVEAVKSSIAENLKAGAYRRGAGTITMQLARNLYLGHDRTLSRKAQEVVLAWVLEHLTGVTKRRLLEIYLNIIEWGPGVHGADEATHYYFDHPADHATTAEALFLATVVPSPRKWRWRFDDAGELRPFARAQMHFIGRAMIARGWLAPEALPPADSLHVELRGPARAVLFPAAPTPDPPLPEAAPEAP